MLRARKADAGSVLAAAAGTTGCPSEGLGKDPCSIACTVPSKDLNLQTSKHGCGVTPLALLGGRRAPTKTVAALDQHRRPLLHHRRDELGAAYEPAWHCEPCCASRLQSQQCQNAGASTLPPHLRRAARIPAAIALPTAGTVPD